MLDSLTKKIGDKLTSAKGELLGMIPEVDFDFITKKLNDLGYKTPKIEIRLTLPPSVFIEIDLDNSVIKEIGEMPEDTETERTLVKILKGLEYAAKMKNKIKISNKKLSRVIVEGSLVPSVSLVYLDEEVKKESYLRDFNS